MNNTESKIASAGIGVASGMGVNYVWNALKLPGYKISVFQIGTRMDGQPLDMGVDDLIELGIGGTITVIGYWKKKDTVMIGGVGFIGGILITKLLEMFGANITPIYPAA